MWSKRRLMFIGIVLGYRFFPLHSVWPSKNRFFDDFLPFFGLFLAIFWTFLTWRFEKSTKIDTQGVKINKKHHIIS